MTMRLIFLTFLLVFPGFANAQTFGAQEFKLANGMQVVVIPNHRAPVVTHMLWMKVGAADEQPGLSGMAHYLEHLLFKGTAKIAPGEFSKTVKTLGGNDNAFTSQDYTAFFESIAVENLPRMMEMEADRMVNINPPEEHFKSEKSVVLEERRQRTDNDPRALFGEQMNSALYINHPYGIPVIGWMNEIEDYDWADVKKFYDTWYAPNNAILVVSGDITASTLKPLAEKYYGAIPVKKLPKRERPLVPPGPAKTLLTLQDPSIHQSVFQKIFIAPAESRNRADSLALQVLSDIMDGGSATRLYKSLVVEQKKATSVSLDYNSTSLDYGMITLGGIPAAGVSPEELGKLLDAEIRKVVEKGVTETEVKESIQRLRDEAIFARDSVTGPAMIFGAALTTGSSVQDVENWPEDIAKVTVERVNTAAKTYLDENHPWVRPPVTGYLLPEEKPAPVPAPAKEKQEAADVQG
ncbi:MAG TPA: pitrilysin family protein [Micavibrio sp.]|nr:pitrilysin family protein [Micavibrio sp.]